MSPKILFVSRYVEPYPIGGNRNVFLQAKSLQDDFGVNVEILTWPLNDLWMGPLPDGYAQIPALKVVREGLKYHVFTAPAEWNEVAGGNAIDEQAWEDAVVYGIKLLQDIDPAIVHLQHRHGLWWLLDSAQRLGIPTVYSNHDWGLACMRTVLVMGNGVLCDGRVAIDKCSNCIVIGRGLAGRLNEAIVRTQIGRKFIALLDRILLGRVLDKRGVVRHPVWVRASMNYTRATRLLSNLKYCFTPSEFGQQFFEQLGVKKAQIKVLPWYHDPVSINKEVKVDQPFTISYVGRVSPEKGVHLIFSALELLNDLPPILLRITGADDSPYCRSLREKYPNNLGNHIVEWLGWSMVEPIFNTTDVAIIPSVWIDNTPLSLIEALSYRVPVVATRIPPIEDLVIDNHNAFLAEYKSIDSLADAIRRAVFKKKEIRTNSIYFPPVLSLKEYMSVVVNEYKKIIENN